MLQITIKSMSDAEREETPSGQQQAGETEEEEVLDVDGSDDEQEQEPGQQLASQEGVPARFVGRLGMPAAAARVVTASTESASAAAEAAAAPRQLGRPLQQSHQSWLLPRLPGQLQGMQLQLPVHGFRLNRWGASSTAWLGRQYPDLVGAWEAALRAAQQAECFEEQRMLAEFMCKLLEFEVQYVMEAGTRPAARVAGQLKKLQAQLQQDQRAKQFCAAHGYGRHGTASCSDFGPQVPQEQQLENLMVHLGSYFVKDEVMAGVQQPPQQQQPPTKKYKAAGSKPVGGKAVGVSAAVNRAAGRAPAAPAVRESAAVVAEAEAAAAARPAVAGGAYSPAPPVLVAPGAAAATPVPAMDHAALMQFFHTMYKTSLEQAMQLGEARCNERRLRHERDYERAHKAQQHQQQ